MEPAGDDVKSLNTPESAGIGEEEDPGLLEWLVLAAGAAPWAYVGAVLLAARSPETSPLGFSGYVSNPTWATAGGTGGGGVSAANAVIDCEPNRLYLNLPPLQGSTVIAGLLFIPYEFVDLQDQTADPLVGTIDLGKVQADVNGQFGFPYTPKVSGNHTIIAVDLDTGVRVTAPLFVYEVGPP